MGNSPSDVQQEVRSEQPSTSSEPSIVERVSATLAMARQRIGLGSIVFGGVGLLVILALLLPPISLLDRMGVVGYETISAENNSVSHPDGVSLSADPEAFTDRLRVRLESVPRLEFLEGSAGQALRKAAEALPDHLIVKSPYYKIRTRGGASEPVLIDVVIPNDAEPWETLDLYTWTGESWEWVGSDLHTEVAENEFIRAEVTELPESVVVVQAEPTTPTVATYLDPDDDLARADAFDAVNPTGLLLGTMGGFAGDVDGLPLPSEASGCAVLPALRNWAPGKSINKGLLSDLLNNPEIQQSHVANVVQLCTERGFDGVDVDYRGVTPEEKEAYTAFIQALAEALHEADLQLSVTVGQPTPRDGGWDTGGYDWAALGASADAIAVPFPQDPAAYAEGGQAQRLLNWATAQVPRDKLRMQVSSLCPVAAEGTDEGYVSIEEALAPFGTITALADVEQVEPQTDVTFGLSGSLLGITPQEAAGTYRLEYKGDDGGSRTVWLGTAANLANKLRWAERYHLGGLTVVDALDSGNVDGIVDVATGYGAGGSAPSPPAMEIAWRVKGTEGTVDQQMSPFTNPGYTWTAPDAAGTYEISASILGFDHGSVSVTVAEPEPEVAEAVTNTEMITGTETMASVDERTSDQTEGEEDGEEDEEGEGECLNAAYVADVTIPDNTQMDKEETFEKTWRVENNGTCAWPEETVLAFVGGELMEAPESVEVGAAETGEAVDVTVPMKAPAEDGTYTGKWQLKSGDSAFGGQLWVTIVVGEPQQAAPAPAPPPSGGGGFELGGHINDWGFPHAQTMHYAGMNWAKVQVHYPQDASGIIAVAHDNGFKIQLSALGSASMVTEPGFEQNYANWVAGLAATGADAIEVWNEPNIDREWQSGHINPQAYKSLLCASYRAIKNANQGTAVISAAPAPTGYFGGCSSTGCDDLPWLQGLYNAGAAQCMDYIGAHHNGGATSPSASTGHPGDSGGHHHSWYFLPQTQLYYNIFGGARKLFYTEMGYASQEGVPTFSDQFAWARGIDNAEQAAWLKEAVQLSINTGTVRCIIIWNIDFSRYGYDPQDGYAIIRPGGGCPACDALHSVLGTR